ncbi:MAG: TIGR04211 family SH3 domain-containing protein [Gammaproteobacteria bacterium]|jgi:SH3 domain protein
MTYRICSIGLCLGCLLLATHAGAQTVYVTDRLQLGLYPESGDRGQPLRTLPSGTPLELLERGRNYARVRTSEGTEGWAKTAFLVAEKPARAQLVELQRQNQSLSQKLTAIRESLSAARQRVAKLEERAASSAALAGESQQRLEALHQENQEFRGILVEHQRTVALPWLFAATGMSLVSGLIGGIWFLDYRIRRRHGGYRVY